MVAQRLERMVDRVRQWRSGSSTGQLSAPVIVAAGLPETDLPRLRKIIDDCLLARGGELAARQRATAIAATFLGLNEDGRRSFFRLLADEYDHDDEAVDQCMAMVSASQDLNERRIAELALAEALRPRRERLLHRFVGLEGGLGFLVDLREELLIHRRDDPPMAAVDDDLRLLLETWFDLALLRLERLTWDDTPAALLEKLIQYEAVHAIESWDDLRGRLGPGRRCYAFLHSMMAGEPLIFVEVALTQGIASELAPLLDHDADRNNSSSADTAIFYSISNCHRGLAGVSLGDFLIKKVVEDLALELPNIKTFATLSPIPGFRRWLTNQLEMQVEIISPELDSFLTPNESALISPDDPSKAAAVLLELISSTTTPPRVSLDPLQGVLTRLVASYLSGTKSLGETASSKRSARAIDPVAHFHLSNGARIEHINWWANPNQTGWERSLAFMVNYRYMPGEIESNHDDYVAHGRVTMADGLQKLLTVQ